MVQVHLDSLTLLDRARPADSPFRNILYSTPDETTQGGLIHITWWYSNGDVPRGPPASIAGNDSNEWDMVVDVRFSTLQVRIEWRRTGASCYFYEEWLLTAFIHSTNSILVSHTCTIDAMTTCLVVEVRQTDYLPPPAIPMASRSFACGRHCKPPLPNFCRWRSTRRLLSRLPRSTKR